MIRVESRKTTASFTPPIKLVTKIKTNKRTKQQKYFINLILSFVLTLLFLLGCLFSTTCFALDNPSFPLMSNLKNSTDYFVGREDFLKNIHDFFFNSDSSDKKDNDSLVVSGAAGSGKTQVITRYAELHKTNYNIIWWFDLSKDLDLQYRNFAKKWNKMVAKHYQDIAEQQYLQIHLESTNTDNLREEIYERLKTTELSWLIILDNVEESVTALKDMPKHSKKSNKNKSNNNNNNNKLEQDYGHIIISTQNSTHHQNVMHLDKLTREESVELLLKVTGESDIKNADTLADTLNDYPLAVSRAGSFISYHTAINMNEYNRLFLNKRQELWEAENKLRIQLAEFDSYKATVFTTLSMIINDIKKESSMAYGLLAISSFLDNEKIPEDLLIKYIKNECGQSAIDIGCKNALSILMRYSMLNRNYFTNKKEKEESLKSKPINTINNSNTNTSMSKSKTTTHNTQRASLFSTHELIQLVMQDLLSPQEKIDYLTKAIIATNNLLYNNIYCLTDQLYNSSYLIAHINSLLQYAKDMKLYNNDVLLLMLRSLEYNLTVMRNDRKAEKLLNKIEEFSKKLKDNDLDDFIRMRLSVMRSAYLAWVKADYPTSLKEIQLAYELMQKLQQASTKRAFFTYKNSPPTQAISLEDQLMIYTRLARMHNLMGNNLEASKYIELGKEIIKEADKLKLNLFGYKEDFFVSIAKIELDNGNYNQALEYYNLCVNNNSNNKNQAKQEQEKKEQILPSNISIFLINIDSLIGLGKYQEAMQKLDSLKAIVDKLPEENFYKLSVMTYYSYIQAMLGGNLTGAIKTSLSHQAMLKKYFGETNYYKNRHAFMSHKFLGEIYEKQGNHLKAEEQYSTALKILNNVYNNSNHSTTDKLSDIYSKLTMVNIKLNNIVDAIEYFKLHRHTFGNEHPRSQMLEDYFVDNQVDLGF